jgi:hypothetical protein
MRISPKYHKCPICQGEYDWDDGLGCGYENYGHSRNDHSVVVFIII